MPDDPDILVPFTTAKTEFEGATIVESLRAAGIRAEVFAAASNTLQWDVNFTDPIKVMVRRADVDRAREQLATVRRDSVDIDYDELFGPADHAAELALARRRAARRRRWALAGMVAMALVAVSWFGPLAIPAALLVAALAGTARRVARSR